MNDKPSFLEIITATFTAGQTRLFALAGSYFELIALPDTVDVRLVDLNGAQRGLMRGAGASFYLTAGGFDTIEITSPTAQTVRFAFGSAQAGTRSSAGTVSVAGVVEQRTMAQAASIASRGFLGQVQQTAVVGQFSCAILANPVASDKRAIIHKIEVIAGAVGPVFLYGVGAVVGTPATVPANAIVFNSGATVTLHRFAGSTVPGGGVFYQKNAIAVGEVVEFDLVQPLILLPGRSVYATQPTFNIAVTANFQFSEELI